MRVYLDTETLGLDAVKHQIYEVAWAMGEVGPVKRLILPHTLTGSDPEALAVGRYHERGIAQEPVATVEQIQGMVDDLTGNTLVCANPPFDRERLSRFLRNWGIFDPEPWHYRSIDVESQAALVLNLDTPPSMSGIVQRFNDTYGADLIPENDHTAVGDVRTMRAVMRFIDGWRATI